MEKEMVQKFDLEAAFKALDEIETPKAKGLKANRVDLKERLADKTYGDALVEDYYNVNDKEALEEAQEDREAEVAKAKLARIEKIVDLDAQTEDDLLPSYVGKVIIQCPQCMTLFYKNPEDIEKSEENPDVVNINEICQHCGNSSGYTLIGKVGEVSPDEADQYEAAEEGTEEDELNLDFGEPTEEVSPEGTGGGFEEEEITFEEGSEDSSDDELDLDLAEVELEPTEESLKHEQLNEGKIKDFRDNKDFEETDRYVIHCCNDKADIIKTVKVHGTSGEVKKLMKDLLDEHKDAADIFASKIFKNLKTGKEEEVELDSYTISRDIEECLKEDLEDKVEVKAEEILDAAAKAGEEVAEAAVEASEELTKEEVKEITDEVVAKELDIPVVEEGSDDSSDDELKEELTPDQVEQKLTAYAASLGVEEGYTGNPAERTTHLEYTDNDPTDGKAVLPDNIEKQLTEGQYDVSDADFKAMLNDKVFQEFGEALTEEKVEEAKVNTAAVKKAVEEINNIGTDEVEEGIGSAVNSVLSGIGNGVQSLLASDEAEKKDCKECEEGLGTAVADITTGVGAGLVNLLASDEAEKKAIEEDAIMNKPDSQGRVDNRQVTKSNEPESTSTPALDTKPAEDITEDAIVPNMDFGGININLDASGQNNAVGFGGSQPKVESCEHCEEEKKVCPKCGKEICECDKVEEGLPGLDSLPSLPGLPGLPGLSEKCEELHEESLNKHISDYLTEVYANVKDFTATDCLFKGNTLVVEGIINFNSGKSRTTKLEFTESEESELGKIILEGYNKDLAEDTHFTLNCLLEDSGKCLLTESFGYKYIINNTLVEGLK